MLIQEGNPDVMNEQIEKARLKWWYSSKEVPKTLLKSELGLEEELRFI